MNYPTNFAKICVILMFSLSSYVKAQSRCDIAFRGILVITKAWLHIVVSTQINKFVFYFTVRRNVNFGVTNANPCTKLDVKSGLNALNCSVSTVRSYYFFSSII